MRSAYSTKLQNYYKIGQTKLYNMHLIFGCENCKRKSARIILVLKVE